MKFAEAEMGRSAVLVVTLAISAHAMAQQATVVPPPMQFDSAEAHYNYLLEQAEGGTRHTQTSLPDWSGIWAGATRANSLVHPTEMVLTEEYSARYTEVQRQLREEGDVRYDRLTHCEPSGYPRWIVEPYFKEFVLTPDQTWLMQDFQNETRRVFTDGRAHDILDGHSWLGDTIGFWDGNKLVTWTLGVMPADYFRGHPENSAELQSAEVWQRIDGEDGERDRISVQATMYDPAALTEPFNMAADYYDAGFDYRIRYWECTTTSNAVITEEGTTTHVLPGEDNYKDPLGGVAPLENVNR